MSGGSKKLGAALALLLLAVAIAACGGGGDSSSSSTQATSAQAGGAGTEDGSNGKAENGAGEAKPGSHSGESGSGGQSSPSDEGSGDFAPENHHDSGGGSAQFRVKGGDNSVQEFGSEADSSELDAAATVLHNFLDARAAGDWQAACSFMSKGIVESFAELASRSKQGQDTSCADILQSITNPAAKQELKEEAEKANVGSLRTEGERAFVIYTGIGGTVLAMPMADEGGAWKVASLAGTPLS